MVRIVAIHSARNGTGKSTVAANTAAILAGAGRRVGLIEANVRAQGLNIFFGLPETEIRHTFNDYLLRRCSGAATVYDISHIFGAAQHAPYAAQRGGRLFLLPASNRSDDVARLKAEGYSIGRMTDDLRDLVEQLRLDIVLIDTRADLQEESLLSILSLAIAHTVVLLLHLDQRDYQGTSVTVEIARRLGVPRITLIANQLVAIANPQTIKQQLEQTFRSEVLALMPYTPEIAAIGSSGLFVLRYPEHPASQLFREMAATLLTNDRS